MKISILHKGVSTWRIDDETGVVTLLDYEPSKPLTQEEFGLTKTKNKKQAQWKTERKGYLTRSK